MGQVRMLSPVLDGFPQMASRGRAVEDLPPGLLRETAQ